jgi:hypothetical protein
VEQVGHAPPSNHKGKGKKGGIRLCKSHPALVLLDVTPRLWLMRCFLRVVGRIPGDVDGVRQEVGRFVFIAVSLPSFSAEERNRRAAAPGGISRILFSCLTYEGEE